MPGTLEAAAVPEHGWVPFGEGTRACIGLRCAVCWLQRALSRGNVVKVQSQGHAQHLEKQVVSVALWRAMHDTTEAYG